MKLLYVNGDSHTAAAEAINTHAFAEDDCDYWMFGRSPHPDNFKVSWANQLASALGVDLHCGAESASSNSRILRTTREWLTHASNTNNLIIIQWSTWEREEWMYEGQYWQVNASGIDDVPNALQKRYKEFIANVDWARCTEQAHREIWKFHQELQSKNIQHVFFNGNSHFETMPNPANWSHCYMNPYNAQLTYTNLLKTTGFSTINPQSWHFGADAHSFWAEHVLQYIKQHNLVTHNALSTD